MPEDNFYLHEPAGLLKMAEIKKWLSQIAQTTGKASIKISDVGCGNGHLSAFMASLGHQVLAIDESAEAIAEANKQYQNFSNVTFQNSSLATGETKYDAVTAFEVCEHVADLPGFINKIKESLTAEGSFIISVPNGWSIEEKARQFLQHTKLGASVKQTLRRKNILPKCSAQSAADSPHVHFLQIASWKKKFVSAGFRLEAIKNVSLFFKQFYYLGARKWLKPESGLFKFLDSCDRQIVGIAPHFLADGWLMWWQI
jgi:2-polyprenyl-3-methyl-5-hydroxy-6-metoxy-1,4-benzoquinol methylase